MVDGATRSGAEPGGRDGAPCPPPARRWRARNNREPATTAALATNGVSGDLRVSADIVDVFRFMAGREARAHPGMPAPAGHVARRPLPSDSHRGRLRRFSRGRQAGPGERD